MFNLDYQEDGYSTGTLSLTEGAWMGRLNARPTVISIAPAFAKDSKAVEEFIIDTYAKAYGAKIGVHYPILMSVRDENGTILAALGFRYATGGDLFLEQYLTHPVEEILDTPRSTITEIGNLASSGGGASIFLFAALSAYLDGKGQTHAVITGTNFIEKRLRALGLKPICLAKANPDLLLRKDENWRYLLRYESARTGRTDRPRLQPFEKGAGRYLHEKQYSAYFPPPFSRGILMVLLKNNRRTAARIKLHFKEPQYQMTYGELPDAIAMRASRFADYRRVALAMNNSIEWVLWDLAAMFSGIALIPIPPFFTKEQREHALRSSGCDAIVTPDGIIPLPYAPVKLSRETAKITFTSGTTGTPKGVCLSYKGMEDVAKSLVAVLGKDMANIHASILPLGVLLENIAGVYATLLAGGTAFLNNLESFGENYANLHRVLAETKATSAILVPEILRTLMAQVTIYGPLPYLKYIAVGGSKVSPDLLASARDLGLPVYEGYGLSECASVIALNTPQSDKAATVGRLLPHISSRIENGEIIVSNTGFLGYIGEDAPAHIQTGDLGEIDDEGFLSITGRKKNVLITSYGRNISPEWVESELLAEKEIAQALVYGDAQPHLSAYVVPSFNTANIAMAIDRVNARLPEYAHIKHFQAIPPFSPKDGTLTGTGRPRRSRIFQLYQQENAHDIL